MSRPLVTIGMPVKNCERTIAQSIRSLQLQTFKDWKLLIADDGSTDRTEEVIRGIKDQRIILLADGKHRGLPARLNQLLALADSPLFARMDGDDIAYPDRLMRQVQYLEERSELDLIGCGMAIFGRDGVLLGKRSVPETHDQIGRNPHAGYAIGHPTFMGKHDWFRRFQYRESAKRCEDQDLLLRAFLHSRFGNVPEILLGYREERIDPKKLALSRWHFGIALASEFRRRKALGTAVWAVCAQAAKGTAEFFALATGLQRWLLRHRAMPVSTAERKRWAEVWSSVSDRSEVLNGGMVDLGDSCSHMTA